MNSKLLLLVPVLVITIVSGCVSQPEPEPGWQVEGKMDYRYGIFTMNTDGTEVVQIYGSDKTISSASFHPSGRIVFYEMEGSNLESIGNSEIAIVNIDGRGYMKLTDNDWMDFQPKWSSDGSEILFVSTAGLKAGTDIYLMDLEGNITDQLTKTLIPSEADPDWKCGKVVFTRNHSIWIMDEDGSNQIQLTDPPGKGTGVGVQFPIGDYDPNLSPDCKKVAFERLMGPGLEVSGINIGDYDIYIYDIETESETDISQNGAADFVPKWSSDGSKIIFIHISDVISDMYDIYMINPDGTGRTKVTGDDPVSFVENGCSWLGNKIIFTAEWFE